VLGGNRIEAVKILAGLTAEDVEAHTARASPSGVDLEGETFQRRYWSPKQRRYCPGCLRGDLRGTIERDGPRAFRPFRRAWWDLSLVENCPIHHVGLLRDCPACGLPLNVDDPWPWKCRCGGDLTKARAPRLRADDCAMDRYVVGRLKGCDPVASAILDGMPLEVAWWAAFYVGWIAMHGRRMGLSTADRTVKAQARRRGLALLADWPLSFGLLLDGMVEGISVRDRPGMSTRITYGALSMWLDRSQEPSLDPLRRVVHDHAERTRAAAPLLIPIKTAAREVHVAEERFFDIAMEHGLLPPGTVFGRKIRLAPVAVARVRDLLHEKLGLKGAAEFLAISMPAFERIVAAGLVTPGDRFSKSRGSRTFSRTGLTSLVERLAGDAPVRSRPIRDDTGLPMAAFKGRIELVRLIPALLEGRLKPTGRMPSVPGLPGILVALGDVMAMYETPSQSMLLEAAAKEFGINYWGLLSLVRAGLIPARQAVGRTNRQWWVRNDDFRDFVGEYATVRHLALRHDVSRNVTRSVLGEWGVKPVTAPPEHPVEVYRYRDAAEALAKAPEAVRFRAKRRRR
jgi:hypothetical protein